MGGEKKPQVELRPWAEGDLPLLKRLMGDAVMTAHLGGPENEEQLLKRHNRYVALSQAGNAVYVVLADKVAAGWVGYWESDWQGNKVWETGWSVLPEFQGQGLATRATEIVIDLARSEKTHRYIHAFPSLDNGASNAICRKVGFQLQGESEVEYPKGTMMRCNDWRIDLFPEN